MCVFETTTRESATRPGVMVRQDLHAVGNWEQGASLLQIWLPPPLGSCGRRFVTQALADGRPAVTDLRNSVPVTRALVRRGAAAEGAVQIEVFPGQLDELDRTALASILLAVMSAQPGAFTSLSTVN